MKKREIDNKPRKGDVLYTDEELMKELNEGLQPQVEAINSAWKVIRAAFPKAILNESFIWSAISWEEVRDYIHKEALSYKMQSLGLSYDYNGERRESQDIKENRRILEILSRKDLAPLNRFLNSLRSNRNLETYLRIGAISFDYDGDFAATSPDAPSLIRDYCSISILSNEEERFVQAFTEARQAATVLVSAYQAIADNTTDRKEQSVIREHTEKDIQNLFVPQQWTTGRGVYLLAENSVWRSMLTFVEEKRQNEAPKFFNKRGYPWINLEYVFRATGYRPLPTPQQRYEHPEVYKDVPFTGRSLYNSEYPCDNEAGLKKYTEDHKPAPRYNEPIRIWR